MVCWDDVHTIKLKPKKRNNQHTHTCGIFIQTHTYKWLN